MPQNFRKFAKFQKWQLDNLEDLEKCWKTHSYLQKSVPIQPKTSNILTKFAEIKASDATTGTAAPVLAALAATDRSEGLLGDQPRLLVRALEIQVKCSEIRDEQKLQQR